MSGTELQVPETMHMDRPEGEPQEIDESRYKNPRDEIMAKIAARYESENRASEIARGDTVISGEEQEAAEGGDEPQPATEEPASPEPATEAAQAAPTAPTLHTIFMPGGQQFQVTAEQMAELAQRGAVATLALQQQPEPQMPPQAEAPRQAGLDRERIKGIAQRITYGSPEDTADALQELVGSVQSVDTAAIRQAAVADALQHIQVQADLSRIAEEFPHIWNSRALAVGAAAELQAIRQRDAALGANRPAIEQYREACTSLMGQLPASAQSQSALGQATTAPQAAPQVSGTQPRLERKRAAPRNPVAASRIARLGDDAPAVQSGSSVIAEMRRARGQPPLN